MKEIYLMKPYKKIKTGPLRRKRKRKRFMKARIKKKLKDMYKYW